MNQLVVVQKGRKRAFSFPLQMVASGDDIEAMCRIVTGNLKEGLATQAPPTEKTGKEN